MLNIPYKPFLCLVNIQLYVAVDQYVILIIKGLNTIMGWPGTLTLAQQAKRYRNGAVAVSSAHLLTLIVNVCRDGSNSDFEPNKTK